jgi:hypothetical protein
MAVFSSQRRLVLLVACGAAVAIGALARLVSLPWQGAPQRLLIAPMIGVVEPCIFAGAAPAGPRLDGLALTCTGAEGSAAALVESTLATLAPSAASGAWELGYTLPVPLLKLFRKDGKDWIIDDQAVQRYARTLRDTARPVIVYLFSTHFAAGAPIEAALQADPDNLSATPAGPLGRDSYYGTPIYNWSVARTDNELTRRRAQAARALLAEICRLEPAQRARVRGVTLLGEVHHLFPNFQAGMGFEGPYRVSDYSAASRSGFRSWLEARFGGIDRLNAMLGTDWKSFDAIEPPSKDIRTTPLADFTEHIDSYAHGVLPVTGWAHVRGADGGGKPSVRIYRNGEWIGTAPVTLGRRDVLDALPELDDADTGWRFDLDFRSLPPGLHRIDVLLDHGPGRLYHLASRQVAIMDRQQRPPAPLPQKALPVARRPDASVHAHVDLPAEHSSYFYNPLVPLWHAFRGQQVAHYLQTFAAVVRSSCLAQAPLYTHQIVPFSNPGWDENKYAIEASLRPMDGLRLGVSLYGEATYGQSFMRWLQSSGHLRYGVTEFHPMKPMDAPTLRRTIEQHAARGAEFISFFLEPRWQDRLVTREHNIFSFDPENTRFGSSELYRSARAALAGP